MDWYSFGYGAAAFSTLQAGWYGLKLWQGKRHKNQKQLLLLQRDAKAVRNIDDPLWLAAFTELNQYLKTTGDEPAKASDFDLKYGWRGSYCGRQICALGLYHSGSCVF